MTERLLKICKSCNTKKKLDAFGRSSSNGKKFVRGICKECIKKIKNSPKGKKLHKIYRRRHYLKHREQIIKKSKDIKILYPWLTHYFNAKYRCLKGGVYAKKGICFCMTKDNFRYLWFKDKAYLLERPSIDRINPAGDYQLNNCRLIELKQNISMADNSLKWKEANQCNLKGRLIKKWKSITDAHRNLGILKTSIINCLKGRSKTSGGFKWEYAE